MLEGIPVLQGMSEALPVHQGSFGELIGKGKIQLEEIVSIVASMHYRGVVHGALTPEYVVDNKVHLSPYTRPILRPEEPPEGTNSSDGTRSTFYYIFASRNEEFDIFCLGILYLLSQGRDIRRYAATGFPASYYKNEEFVGVEMPSYWKSCLHRNPCSRPSIWDAPNVKHRLLIPLPVLPLNNLFTNEFLYTFSVQGFLVFDLARKYPADVIRTMEEDGFRNSISSLQQNLIMDTRLPHAILHHETLPLYHMLPDATLFHRGIQELGKYVRLCSVSDSYLLEFFCSYARSVRMA